jgi:membrane protease YdiL (CAAX protease family)
MPPRRSVGGLPYGWAPIILSSLLFAAAHFGYGPEPVPLFVLALVLGYCYQRTHRILPCIIAHSLFNLNSMIVLWRIVLQGVE